MDFQFERGDAHQPKGHALVYFQGGQSGEDVLATYLVVLPVAIELGKYLPPLFAAQMPQLGHGMPSVVPLPPVPEKVSGRAYLQLLAAAREDDLIFGGRLAGEDLQQAIQSTSEIAQRYLDLYHAATDKLQTVDAVATEGPPQGESELNVHEVMYSLMGEHDRLQELTKLAGQLRYAVDGGDKRLVADTVAEMETLGKYLPAKYRVAEFLRAAQTPGERGHRLAALYMDRCYKLYREDYAGLSAVEAELKELQAEG